MTGTAQSPNGRRLIIDIVDDIAERDPGRPYLYQPRTSLPKDGWAPVTFGQLANAVNHVARIIRATVTSKASAPFPTVSYIGPSDARYGIILMACVKAGAQAFFLSPRNSLEGQLSLLDETDCSHFWHADSFTSQVELWAKHRPMETTLVPPLDEWLQSKAEPFPYERSFEEAEWDPLVVLHSSGSTGIPKPIVIRQGSYAVFDLYRDLPDFFLLEVAKRATRILTAFPLFHAAGTFMVLIGMSVLYGVPCALLPPDHPIEAGMVRDCLAHAEVDAAMAPPSIIEDLTQDEDGMAQLKKLKLLMFGGGSLPQSVRDELVRQRITLVNAIASTENAPYAFKYQPDPAYFWFDDETMGANWQAVDASSNAFRLIFKRKHPTLPCQQPIFYTFPHLDEYSTGDLYEPHPEKPGLWKYLGRGDDIIVFTNGEKLNPVTIQDAIQGHPSIKGALVVGQEKFQPALILEPREPCKTPEDAEQLIEHIWPTVERVNEVTVAHGRIVRQLVMVSDPELPFLRTPKGTVQRRLTIAAYQAKIDKLYEEASLGAAQESFALDFQSEAHLARSIIALLEHVLGVDGLYPDTDLFSRGIDSLQVMSFATALRISLPAEKLKALSGPVDHRTVYKHPSAAKLAAHLFKSQDAPHTNGLGMMQDIRTTESFVSKYTENLPPAANSAKPAPSTDDQVVVLTGTTGTLGAHMLHELCLSPNVRKVYALNRGKDGGESRQGSISASRGLCTDFSKVEFLGVDLSLADFGIGTQKFEKLCQSVDRIIHNAWPVNFNWSVESFEPHIRGVRHLVDFSHAATKTVPIIFISSIGTVQNWKSDSAIPEQPFDASVSTMGYGLSKTASSLILDEARMRSGIPTASVRVGQIAGPKGRKGIWNPQEMVPTIIASSVYLGMLPDDPCTGEVIEWMAIEDVSRVILDIAGVTAPVSIDEISGYFHLVNPNKTTWSEIVPALRDYYGDRITNTVSLKKWVEALKASATRLDDIDKNPGIKLLDSIEAFASKEKSDAGFVRLETKRTERLSPTMSRFEKVTPELVKNWCDQWGY